MIFELHTHMLNENPVYLNNSYKGIPVHHRAIIRMVNQDYLALDIHPEQCACFQLQKHTIITGKYLKFPIKAYLVNVDRKFCSAVFSGLTAFTEKMEKITMPCLKPVEVISCEINFSDFKANAHVVDFVLENKHSCIIHLSSHERIPLEVKSEAILAVSIPSAGYPGAVPARLRQIYKIQGEHPAWRYRFTFPLDEPAGKPVKDYLATLKKEIKQDLRDQAARIRQNKK